MFPGGLEIGELEAEAAARVIRSRRLIRFYGPDDQDDPGSSEVDELERAFARRMGSAYALGLTSGTASLITGLAALGVGPGDEVIVPAYTFIASPSAVLAVGAIPIVAEIDDSLTLDPVSVRAADLAVHEGGHAGAYARDGDRHGCHHGAGGGE